MLSPILLAACLAAAPADADPAHDVAVTYLKALAGQAEDKGRELLLGGVPLAAKDYTIPNWNIVVREPVQREKKRVLFVKNRMRKLDKRGAKALSAIVKSQRFPDAVNRKRAKQLLAATKSEADAFTTDFPVFAYVARVGKDVFWHPNNPWRKVLTDLGDDGSYELELHLFRIEERAPDRPPRVWPLRVVRITSSNGYDSGYKVLPASDWDPEY